MKLNHLILFVSALAVAGPAAAQMISAKDPKGVAAFLQEKGYRAEIVEDDDGPYIRSADSGVKFTIFFMNCEEKKNCKTVQFYAGFTDMGEIAPARINEWNKTKRFARAYIDAENDPVLELDVDLDHQGIPRENFYEYVDIFTSLAPAYRDFLRQK